MRELPIRTAASLDFDMSSSFPPDTDPAYILGEIADSMERHGLHLVALYRRGEGGATYAEFKLPPGPTQDRPQ